MSGAFSRAGLLKLSFTLAAACSVTCREPAEPFAESYVRACVQIVISQSKTLGMTKHKRISRMSTITDPMLSPKWVQAVLEANPSVDSVAGGVGWGGGEHLSLGGGGAE